MFNRLGNNLIKLCRHRAIRNEDLISVSELFKLAERA